MATEFKCRTSDLRRVIKLILSKQPKKKTFRKGIINIIVKKDRIEIITMGELHTIIAKNKTQAIVSMPRIYFESIAEGYKDKDFVFSIENGKLKVRDNVSLNDDIRIEPVEDERYFNELINKLQVKNEFDLNVNFNYSDRELLWIKNKYNIDELEKNKLVEKIYEAQTKRDDCLKKAYNLLKIYGVTKFDLNKLVDSYIENFEW